MARQLPRDFVAFLKLLGENEVDYLVVGGYAVGHFGYPRATGDIDLWIRPATENATRLVEALRAFGFDAPNLRPELFLNADTIVRLGIPPNRIEIMSSISGVAFDDAFEAREVATWHDVTVNVIGLKELKQNKQATGRPRDLDDLANLP